MTSQSRLRAAFVTTTLLLAACDGVVNPTQPTAASFIVSNSISTTPGAGNLPAVDAVEGFVYISLSRGVIPGASSATISNERTGTSYGVQFVDGGFDPVQVAAVEADSISIDVRMSASNETRHFGLRVPKRVPPKVVRTDPPRQKRDVPLNHNLAIVFSEPIDAGSISSATVSLRKASGAIVNTTITANDPAGLVVYLSPGAFLEPNTAYELSITSGVRDRDGDNLLDNVTVSFSTAPPVPAASIGTVDIIGIPSVVAAGTALEVQAVVRDRSGVVVPYHDIRWTTSLDRIARVTRGTDGKHRLVVDDIGRVTIAAWAGSKGASADLNVQGPYITVDAPWEMAYGETAQLSATYYDISGKRADLQPTFEWKTANSAIAQIDLHGAVRTISPGQTEVSAGFGTMRGRAYINVNAFPAGEPATVRLHNFVRGLPPLTFASDKLAPLQLAFGESATSSTTSGTIRSQINGVNSSLGDYNSNRTLVLPGMTMDLFALGDQTRTMLMSAPGFVGMLGSGSSAVRIVWASNFAPNWLGTEFHVVRAGAPIGTTVLSGDVPGVQPFVVVPVEALEIVLRAMGDANEARRFSITPPAGRSVSYVIYGDDFASMSLLEVVHSPH